MLSFTLHLNAEEMNSKTTLNYHNKIKCLLTDDKFKYVEQELVCESNERLEAFWHIVIAGYSIDFALVNYIKLYEYLRDKPIDYSEALTTYATYPGLESGMYVTKTKWFELN
jgi:hypothetical protein